jgi:hypothetical protein
VIRALAGVAVAALAMLAFAGPAAAKKKGGKGNTVSAVNRTATQLQPAVASTPAVTGRASVVSIPLRIGKKAKGNVVGPQGISVTYTLSGSAVGSLPPITVGLVAPNGRVVGLENPAGDPDTTVGPLTQTPNTITRACTTDPTPPANPPCFDPDATVNAPYSSAPIANLGLDRFSGLRARGSWAIRAYNSSSTTTAVLSAPSIRISLEPPSR